MFAPLYFNLHSLRSLFGFFFHKAQSFPAFLINIIVHVLIFSQKAFDVFTSLPDSFALVRIPGTAFINYPGFDAQVKQVTGAGNALTVHDIEFRVPEWRCHFIFHHFYPGPVARYLTARFDRLNAPDVQAHRGIEFQRIATARRLRAAEHHPDLVP